MEIQEGFIAYKSSQVEFRRLAGNTEKIIILFHGFGDKAFLFEPIMQVLAKKYDVWALSFPYHGKTDWKEGKFYKADITFLINQIREITGKKRLSLLGYSMGGKIVLNILQDFAEVTDELILLASDGIKTHKLYDIHALPPLFIQFLKSLMKRPKLFFKTAKFFHKKGILTKFLYDFTKNHFSTPEQRQRFFMVYDSLKAFKPDLDALNKLLVQNDIPVKMFLGLRDEVILPVSAEEFSRDLPNCQVFWLDKGHLLVDEDLVLPLGNALGIA